MRDIVNYLNKQVVKLELKKVKTQTLEEEIMGMLQHVIHSCETTLSSFHEGLDGEVYLRSNSELFEAYNRIIEAQRYLDTVKKGIEKVINRNVEDGYDDLKIVFKSSI